MMAPEHTRHLQTAESAIRHLADPKALYLTLFHRWKWLLACTILGSIFGVLAIAVSEKKFESTGRLLVYQKLPTFMDDSTRLPDHKAYDSLFATHLQLIGSPFIIDKAVQQFQIDQCRSILDSLEERQTSSDYVRNHIKVSRAGSGDSAGAFVIKVVFDHHVAEDCPQVVDAILKTYKQYLDETSLAGQSKAVGLIQDMESALKQEIAAKGDQFREHIRNSPGIWDPDSLRNTHQKRVDLLEIQQTELEIKRTAIQSRIRIMESAANGDNTDLDRLALVDDEHVPRLEMLAAIKVEGVAEFFQLLYPERQEFVSAQYDDLLDLFVEKTTLKGNLGPDHPRIKDLESDIKVLEAKLNERQSIFLDPNVKSQLQPDDLVRAYERFLKLELGDVNQRITNVKSEIAEQFAAARKVMNYSFEAQQLHKDYDRSVELYNAVVDKLRKQNLLSQFGSYTTEIIHPPVKSHEVWPNKPVMLALCTILGGFLGIVIAIVLDLRAAIPA